MNFFFKYNKHEEKIIPCNTGYAYIWNDFLRNVVQNIRISRYTCISLTFVQINTEFSILIHIWLFQAYIFNIPIEISSSKTKFEMEKNWRKKNAQNKQKRIYTLFIRNFYIFIFFDIFNFLLSHELCLTKSRLCLL